MAAYDLEVHPDVNEFLSQVDEKSERIIKDHITDLAEDPHPGSGTRDKEQLVVDGEEIHRLHISRTYTAFYDIIEDEQTVRVFEVLPIDEAHKRYGH